jgi:hypothetical protein
LKCNGTLLHQQNFTGSENNRSLDSGFSGVNTTQPFERLRTNKSNSGDTIFVARDANFYSGDNHGSFVLSAMGVYKENRISGTALIRLIIYFIHRRC